MMKIFLLLGFFAALGAAGCATFSGAESSAEQNLDQGLEGRGRLVAPPVTGDAFGSYYN